MSDKRPVLKGKITITRPVGGPNGSGVIRIAIEDDLSGARFVEAEVTLAHFAEALTGMAFIPVDLRVAGLGVIGKQRVTEPRSIECPLHTYNKDELTQWLVDNAQEEGWKLNTYLGSQNSVVRRDDKTVLNYSVTKYVEVKR
jgi:hypothetical protein